MIFFKKTKKQQQQFKLIPWNKNDLKKEFDDRQKNGELQAEVLISMCNYYRLPMIVMVKILKSD